MIEFYLYRLKIERPELALGDPSRSASDIITSAIREKPSPQDRHRPTWRIGNVQVFGNDAVFFALGKITKSTHGLYDESRGDFVERAFEEAPHTYVAVELKLQVCAIAQKGTVTSSVDTIAKNLARILTSSHAAGHGTLVFKLSRINDPDEFISLVRNADRISEFVMTFSPPNPFDVDRQFHQPMEQLLKASNAANGKTSIKGDQLEPDTIEILSRSAASTGNMATARIQSEGSSKPILKKLGENPLTIPIDEIATDDEKLSLFGRIRETYRRVRGGEDEI